MKKFTQVIGAIHEAEVAKKSELQKSYQEYFTAKMNKFGVKSPAELSTEQKAEFFNEITKDWNRGKGATKAGQADVEEHGIKESAEVNEGTTDPLRESQVILDTTDPNHEALDKFVHAHSIKMKEANPGNKGDFAKYEFTGSKKDLTEMIKKFWGDEELVDTITEAVNEAQLDEGEIKSEEQFKEYATKILKKAHKDDYDEKKADATIAGVLKKANGDFGKAAGIIGASLGEGNAFGDAVTKAKKAGKDEFEFQGKTYKVEESTNEALLALLESE